MSSSSNKAASSPLLATASPTNYHGETLPDSVGGSAASGFALVSMQVRALIRKDWIVARRHSRRLILEFIFPLLMGTLSCLFMSVFLNFGNGKYSNYPAYLSCTGASFINYAPLNVTYPDLIGPYAQYCWSNSFTHYNNFSSMYDGYLANLEYQQQHYSWISYGAIMWLQNFSTVSYPDFPMGSLEFHTIQQYQLQQGAALGQKSYYYFNNATQYVNFQVKENSIPQQFNSFLIFSTAAGIMLSLTFLPMTTTLAGRLVDEKKAKVREHLRVMGVSPFAYLFASFLVSLIRVSFVSFAMLILIGAFNIVPVGSLFLIWLSLMFYGFSLAGFAQVMPSFFSRSTMSNAVVSIFIAATGIGAVFASQIDQLNPLLCMFFSPSAFVIGMSQLMNKEYVTLNVPAGGAIGFLFVHMVFYNLLAQYLYDINPGEFGVPRPLLYPLHDLRDLIFGAKKTHNVTTTGQQDVRNAEDENDRIILEGLVKVFGNDTDSPAVNRLSLRVHAKEIFALLGHNGAGKTTTISILIGMLTSTHYDRAEILGMDLNQKLAEIRRYLAVCPQFDVLFDDLSAREHLELYAAVRGRPALREAVDELLHKLRLPLTDQKSSTFSGGMRRRLSVGNSLVGDAPIVFLDEPSSGLDPLSRRCLWELLKEERTVKGKSIILTTHFMEEADYLGDRIAIMSHGRLFCCNTSAHLKEQYGVGFYLQLVKAVGSGATTSTAADPTNPVKPHAMNQQQQQQPQLLHANSTFRRDLVEGIIQRFTTNYTFHHESIGDATILLHPSTVPLFGEMLRVLEENLEACGCTSYGISTNTLEDVFVNISEREAKIKEDEQRARNLQAGLGEQAEQSVETTLNDRGENMEALFAEAAKLPWMLHLPSQIWTTLVKRNKMFFRSGRSVLVNLIVPLVLVGIGFGAVIPNFLNQGSGNSWASYYSGQAWPDVTDVSVWIYQTHDTWSPQLDETLDVFTQLYTTYYAAQGIEATFRFRKTTKHDYNTGAFLGGKSISFLQTHNPMLQMEFHDEWNTNFTAESLYPKTSTTYFFDDSSYAGMYMMVVHQLFAAAAEMVWRKAHSVATPVVLPNGVPMPMATPTSVTNPPTTTLPPTPAPTTNTPPRKRAEFILVPLGVLMNICIAQFAAGAILPFAEEWNRKIYHTTRLHGLSAAGYWIGTFLFDMLNGLVIVVAYIIGAYARGVKQIQNEMLICQCVFIVWVLATSLLIAYNVVVYLPENLKQSTYLYAVSGVMYLMLLIPLIIMIAMMSTGNGTYPEWIQSMTPPRALLAVIITDQINHPEKIWSSKETVAGYIAVGIFNGVALFFLIEKIYVSQIVEHNQGKPRAAVNGQPPAMGYNAQQPTYSQVVVPQPGYLYAPPPPQRDVDVMEEQERVLSQPLDNNMAAVVHLRKIFRGVASAASATASRGQAFFDSLCGHGIDKVAVNDVTFGVRSGECFGLLGPNGAGKTTTVKMMLRELANTDGQVAYPYTQGEQNPFYYPFGGVDESYRSARLGCCQQHDTLWENLDAREHMELYLRFRLGPLYDGSAYREYINRAIKKVYLEEAGDKQAGRYSGGMKRKLSVCIAMYTGAKTVFLDEPSTGMDPYARRALWRSINEALKTDRCVLLTTHSMEEADAVCSRIAIMTSGELQCIGNGMHLKQRFGTGYSIVVSLFEEETVPRSLQNLQQADRLSSSEAGRGDPPSQQVLVPMGESTNRVSAAPEVVDEAMRELFGAECHLKEVLGPQRRYAVPTLQSLSYAFASLESRKEQLGLRSYGVNQMSSLDQIFLFFAGSNAGEGN